MTDPINSNARRGTATQRPEATIDTGTSRFRPIVRVRHKGGYNSELLPELTPEPEECLEVLQEGYDPTNSPLRRPVHWRVERRRTTEVYCSTFRATHAELERTYGRDAAATLSPDRSGCLITIETLLSERAT